MFIMNWLNLLDFTTKELNFERRNQESEFLPPHKNKITHFLGG